MLLKPRKRPASDEAIPTVHVDDLPPAKRGRGRPMKHVSDLKPPQYARIKQANLLHSQQTTHQADIFQSSQLSPLEALPVELIHQIFFYALEANMARASPHLAHALSKPSIYSALILFAYFADEGIGPVDKQLFLPAQYVPIPLDERIRLQQGILACRWCTLDLFKSTVPILSRLVMVQAWHREANNWAGFPHSSELESISLPEEESGFRDMAVLPSDPNERDAMEAHFFATWKTIGFDSHSPDRCHLESGELITDPRANNEFLPRIIEWEYSQDHVAQRPARLIKRTGRARAVLDVRCLPDHIVSGYPEWTTPRLQLLMLLRQSMRFLPESHNRIHMSIGALFDGLALAIKSHNTKALLVLLELYFALCYNPPDINPRLPLEFFHLAAQQAQPQSSEMMSLLIRASLRTIPAEDYILTSWAVRNKIDPVAIFLLRHMAGANEIYEVSPGNLVFTNGRLGRHIHLHVAPFALDEFTNEVPYYRQDTARGTASYEHLKLAE